MPKLGAFVERMIEGDVALPNITTALVDSAMRFAKTSSISYALMR